MRKQFPHYVLGYGSLICPQSRAITAPTLANRAAIPVVVQNVERTWAKRSRRGMTVMGVRFRKGAECVGVLLPVTETELAQFDKREVGYDRYELHPDDVEPVPFLQDDYYKDTFLENEEFKKPSKIWIYVQQDLTPAGRNHPIAQSYVDIILRGCLSISEEFAHEFIATTKGWHPKELNADRVRDYSTHEESACDDDDDDDVESNGDELPWVDDRSDPLYVRADPEYSLAEAKKLDRLLTQHLPDITSRRRRRQRLKTPYVTNQ